MTDETKADTDRETRTHVDDTSSEKVTIERSEPSTDADKATDKAADE